jgi:hypothetical protein
MHLQRGLRREADAGALLETNHLLERVSTENAWRRPGENHVKAVGFREAGAYAKRRLSVRIGQHGAPAAAGEHQLEPGEAADVCGPTPIARQVSGQTATPARST